MSSAALLKLHALHAAAPGILDVVFGPDGPCDLWLAPVRGRIAIGADHRTPEDWYWVAEVLDGGRVLTTDCAPHVEPDGAVILDAALDCRVSSVAGRLAGLCARAMDPEATGQAWVSAEGESRPDFWVLWYSDAQGAAISVAWAKTTGSPNWRALSPCPVSAPTLPPAISEVSVFLANLVTALAPRIAAIGGAK